MGDMGLWSFDAMKSIVTADGGMIYLSSDELMMKAKEQGVRPLGVEGERVGEWVLVDFGDVVVHVMQPAARSFYDLERLWSVQAAQPESS